MIETAQALIADADPTNDLNALNTSFKKRFSNLKKSLKKHFEECNLLLEQSAVSPKSAASESSINSNVSSINGAQHSLKYTTSGDPSQLSSIRSAAAHKFKSQTLLPISETEDDKQASPNAQNISPTASSSTAGGEGSGDKKQPNKQSKQSKSSSSSEWSNGNWNNWGSGSWPWKGIGFQVICNTMDGVRRLTGKAKANWSDLKKAFEFTGRRNVVRSRKLTNNLYQNYSGFFCSGAAASTESALESLVRGSRGQPLRITSDKFRSLKEMATCPYFPQRDNNIARARHDEVVWKDHYEVLLVQMSPGVCYQGWWLLMYGISLRF